MSLLVDKLAEELRAIEVYKQSRMQYSMLAVQVALSSPDEMRERLKAILEERVKEMIEKCPIARRLQLHVHTPPQVESVKSFIIEVSTQLQPMLTVRVINNGIHFDVYFNSMPRIRKLRGYDKVRNFKVTADGDLKPCFADIHDDSDKLHPEVLADKILEPIVEAFRMLA